MSLRPIYGHDALRDRLAGAIAAGRFPQATLFVGSQGVGKQRLALWVAQGLLCQDGPGTPCGRCDTCQRVLSLSHPDVHWFVPVPRPRVADSAKQVEEIQELLGRIMAERRKEPFWRAPDGMAGHSLASVRLLHRVTWVTPFMGSRKVIIVGDGERLVVQESSEEAANALLKVLEEPPADTTVILTAADPQALLPTIRSRLVPIRVAPVRDDDVRRFLENEVRPPVSAAVIDRRTVLAKGCVGKALAGGDDAEGGERRATEVLEKAREAPGAWAGRALAQPPWGARGEFSAMLDALAVKLRAGMLRAVEREGAEPQRWVDALGRVEETRAAAQGNINPQLALAVLASDLEELE